MKRSSSLLLAMLPLLLGACATQPTEESSPLTGEQPIPVAQTPANVDDTSGFLASLPPDPYYLQTTPALSEPYKKRYQAALALLKEEKTTEAEAALLALLEDTEKASAPCMQLALLYKRQDNIEMARQYAQKAIAINPYNYDAYNLLGVIEREAGHFSEAEQHYQQILALWPGYAPAHRNLGILYDLYQGQYANAADHYQKYLLLVGEDKTVAIWLADLQRRIKEQEAADEAPATP